MIRTTPELALLSPSSRTTPTGWRLITTCDLARNGLHTMESGFEPGILQLRSQDLSTGPPRPPLQLQASWHPQTNHLDHRFMLLLKPRSFFFKVKKYALFTWPILPDFGMALITRFWHSPYYPILTWPILPDFGITNTTRFWHGYTTRFWHGYTTRFCHGLYYPIFA
ncbi:hypothetical protein AVEN_99746-1 [Araneus ventricosus]|uniref:Uncharacterized protein n=1 Tax=Araneus ventricosus TaxID=182803 RepID=A0A4Y2DKX4_ARAVE|nr:hypothetical protein AVEN_99746-1 [Araneus ventricosus]